MYTISVYSVLGVWYRIDDGASISRSICTCKEGNSYNGCWAGLMEFYRTRAIVKPYSTHHFKMQSNFIFSIFLQP